MTYATLFRIVERDDPDDARRLTLTGELDLATAPELQHRIDELGAAHRPVRIDLSELEFADSTGITTILLALNDAVRDGRELEVNPDVPSQVARVIGVMGVAQRLWSSNGR